MNEKHDLLRVAHPKGCNSATNAHLTATPTATPTATATLKALAHKVLERNSQRNKAQQQPATSATNTPEKGPVLLRPVAHVPMVPDKREDPLRWPRFIALCVAHGATENEVKNMFRPQDIEDLCMESDCSLAKHARTITDAIKRDPQRQQQAPTVKARKYQVRHRCGRCRHFTFNPQTAGVGLGWCNGRSDVAMALPSRLIECDEYQQRKPKT